jgi:hypothetical protein
MQDEGLTRMRSTLFGALAIAVGLPALAQGPVHHRVLATDPTGGAPIVQGGDFEGDLGPGWTGWASGYELDDGIARSGQRSARVSREADGPEAGVQGSVTFEEGETPAMIIVSAWSRAEGVSGSPDSGYSLYLDITYADGTNEWGVNRPFSVGTHGWERRQVVLRPAKPVRTLHFYGLFRGHTGTAWFDDFDVRAVAVGDGALFDGLPVMPGERLQGFSVRDVEGGSDIRRFAQGPDGVLRDEELALELRVTEREQGGATILDAQVLDLRGQGDRAVTLYYTVPLDNAGVTFWDTPRRSRPATSAEYSNTRPVVAGNVGRVSVYPFACVSGAEGRAIGAPLTSPRLFRFGYNADTQELFAAVDLSLCADYERLPGGADFTLVLFDFDGAEGMRGALERYYELFPEHFEHRAIDQGIWMPFSHISQVQGWEDFGFLFKEGDGEPSWDSENGIETYPYIEPSSNWMAMPPDVTRTHEAAVDYLYANREQTRNSATLTSGIEGADGQPWLRIEDAPWCDGALFLLNPAPSVSRAAGPTQFDILREAVETAVFGADTEIEGQYVDSLEMGFWEANYRRDHIQRSAIPPTFDAELRPMLLLQWSVFEFTGWLKQRIHEAGKKTFANAALWTAPWHAAHFDIMGTEVNWGSDDDFRPDSDDLFLYRRALCYRRPYVMLMNTHYDEFTEESVRRYFDRCLFYGCWPSFFSHNAAEDPYWQNPALYNRDRTMFMEYIPKVRAIAEAGWEPVSHATSSNERVLIERWRGEPPGTEPTPHPPIALTIHNDSPEPQLARIEVDLEALGLGEDDTWTGVALGANDTTGAFHVELQPYETLLIVARATEAWQF